MSPVRSSVLSGGGFPLIFAAAAWRPISEWMRKAKSRAEAPARERNDPALGREDVDLLGDEVDLEVLQEFAGVLLVAEELDHLAQPLEAVVLLHRGSGRPSSL